MGESGTRRTYQWTTDVVAEGGPVLVAEVDAYVEWGGVHPASEEGPQVVTFYGPLVGALPARFQPSGAEEHHQVLRVADPAAVRAYLDELRAAAQAVVPGLVAREQNAMEPAELAAKARAALAAQGAAFVEPLPAGVDAAEAMAGWLSAWRDHLEQGIDFYADGECVLHVEAEADTDYRRACDALREDDALTVEFGAGNSRSGVVWELEGAGVASVACAADGFLLLRTWVDEDEYEQQARNHAVVAPDDKEDATEVTFPDGRVIVVWAPVVLAELEPYANVTALRAAADLDSPTTLDSDGWASIGTLVRVPPGTYRVTCGAYDEAPGWSCRWARFTRSGPLPA